MEANGAFGLDHDRLIASDGAFGNVDTFAYKDF